MAFVRSVFNLIGISAPAVVVVVLLPEWLGTRLEFALIAGTLVFLCGAALLEINGRPWKRRCRRRRACAAARAAARP